MDVPLDEDLLQVIEELPVDDGEKVKSGIITTEILKKLLLIQKE